jgi:hypothetical protein
MTAVGMALLPFTTTRAAWLGLALLQGLGVAGAATAATLFVVEVHPEAEWDERIAWLYTFYDGGHVSGLLLAAWVSQTDLRLSLPVLAGGTVVAAVLGWWTTRPLLHRCCPHPYACMRPSLTPGRSVLPSVSLITSAGERYGGWERCCGHPFVSS